MATIIMAADLQVGDFFVLPAGLRSWGEVLHQVAEKPRQLTVGHTFTIIKYTAWASAERVVKGEHSLRENVHVKKVETMTSDLAIAAVMALTPGDHLQIWRFGGRFYL